MNKFLFTKEKWGIFPISIFIVLLCIATIIGDIFNISLRSLPRMVLFWYGAFSFVLFIILGIEVVFNIEKVKLIKNSPLIKKASYIVLIPLTCFILYTGTFLSSFSYTPEHIITRNDIKMVASVNGGLDVSVSYHEYKNFLFYGSYEIGYEYYGSGSYNPFNTEDAKAEHGVFYDLEGEIIEFFGQW